MANVISRHWRGLAKAERSDEYVEHLRSETFPALHEIPGFLGALILRRPLAQGVEFLVIAQWASLAAIHAFAGLRAESAVVPEKVLQMMLEYDSSARHYEVVV